MFCLEMQLCGAFKEAGFEESTLLLLEHLMHRSPSPAMFCAVLRALFANSNYEAVRWMVQRRREYFEYEEVKIIYIESAKRLGALSDIESGITVEGKSLPKEGSTGFRSISQESVCNYYQGLVRKGRERKVHMDLALQKDERNLEAFIYIATHYSTEYVKKCIDRIEDKSVHLIFSQILFNHQKSFSLFSKEFMSPFSCIQIAKSLFNRKRCNEIYQLSQYMAALYPKHYLSYVVAGMYYMLVQKYTDAKRALFQSIQINNSFGVSWLLLGYCQSALCECINAISCFEKAEILMEDGVAALLGIGLEYHKMRSYAKAEDKYLEIEKRYSIDHCFKQYVSLLITKKRYKEATEIVRKKKYIGEVALLQSCCYLFNNEEDAAENILNEIDIFCDPESRSKHYLLRGYVHHLKKEYCAAIEMYQKAILDPSKTSGGLINDLLEIAIKNSLEDDGRKLAEQYKEDIFEFLDLKTDFTLLL